MSALTELCASNLVAVIEDLEPRDVIYPEPPELPPAASLVRLPGGMVGEVVIWLDRNPDGIQEFSDQRVALVELTDSVADDIPGLLLPHRRAVTEADIAVLRNTSTPAAIRRWLRRWDRLRPESFARDSISSSASGNL